MNTERDFKEVLLHALVEQAKAKIKSIEGWTKQMHTGNNLGYDIPSLIREKREDLKEIQKKAEELAKELGMTEFSWSTALKEE